MKQVIIFGGVVIEMNISYICMQLVGIVHGNIVRLDRQKNIVCAYGDLFAENLSIYEDSSLMALLGDMMKENKEVPVLMSQANNTFYAVIPSNEDYFVLGPVRPYDINEFGRIILMLFHIVSGKEIPLADLWHASGMDEEDARIIGRGISNEIFQRQESGIPHNPYEQEVREMSSIEQGNIAMLTASLQESYPGTEGRLSDDELRQAKNIAIVVIALASRAAIRGGMMPEEAFAMVDSYIQNVEKMDNQIKIKSFMRQAEYEFTRAVAELSDRRVQNDIVEKVKNYIFQHLHDEIVIGDIGRIIGVNTSYLSSLFKKTEGITIQHFIRREKIKLAENMLRYSGYSLEKVANFLGFCSQSHFGKAFKEEIGTTPAKYRCKYGRKINPEQ